MHSRTWFPDSFIFFNAEIYPLLPPRSASPANFADQDLLQPGSHRTSIKRHKSRAPKPHSRFAACPHNPQMPPAAFCAPLQLPLRRPLHRRASVAPRMAAEQVEGGVTAPPGFRAAAATAGFKDSGAPDLAVVVAEGGLATVAGVFTQCKVRAAPVVLSERYLADAGGKARVIVLNSGQANAATGSGGAEDALATAALAAQVLECEPCNVLLCSTGVIGKRFDFELMKRALPGVLQAAESTVEAGLSAARAIMTTDLKLKHVAFQDVIDGVKVTVGGMCKGSGMIHPGMATMLGVVTCDADVEPKLWQQMLKRAVDKSFNAITVDGDMSTNDVVFAMCNGASAVSVTDPASPAAHSIEKLLTDTCIHLAKSVARDGEGATVLVEVRVTGALTDADARLIARTVAGSNLNKAAIFGRDPNWGRIAAAAGRAGADFDPSLLDISVGEHSLLRSGEPLSFDAKAASEYLAGKAAASPEAYLSEDDTVLISISVGKGPGEGCAWGCDLSYKYVEINSEYST